MSSQSLRIATRKSALALWQAEHVSAALRRAHPALDVELVPMTTQGDRVIDSPLAKVGGKGLFVKELEQAMLDGRADIAVHSVKDVTAELPEGLVLRAILAREDPRDAFVSRDYSGLDQLPKGARVGTSSLRRQCQLRAQRTDLEVVELRGNVNTRLDKLYEGLFDAIILACAGLKRLGQEDRIRQELGAETLLPAIGQGAIGIETRAHDPRVEALISVLADKRTTQCVSAERALGARMGGSCQVPIAGFAEIGRNVMRLRGLVGQPDGSAIVRGEISGPPEQAESLGSDLADDLLSRGADAILRDLYEQQT